MATVRVHLGSDHAGFELKAHLIAHLASLGHDAVDVGAATYDPADDYPPYCIATGLAVLADPGSLGIVIGGSGNGEQIAANKVPGHPVPRWPGTSRPRSWPASTTTPRSSRSARACTRLEDAAALAEAFVAEPFSEDPRHQRRIDMVAEYEKTARPPPLPGRRADA